MKNLTLKEMLILQAPPKPADWFAPYFPESQPEQPKVPEALREYEESYKKISGFTTIVNFLLHNPGYLWSCDGFGPENKEEILQAASEYDNALKVWAHNYKHHSQRKALWVDALWRLHYANGIIEMMELWESTNTED